MKNFLITLAMAFTIISQVFAQNNSSRVYEAFADSLMHLYNKKYYPAVYKLTSADFQSQVREDEFFEVLVKGIYTNLAEMEKMEPLEPQEEKYHSFLVTFKNGQLQMNVLLNEQKQADLLQFVTYQETPKTKITSYLSDNKKITPLDSVVEKSVLSFIQSPQNCGISIGIFANGTNSFYNYGELKRGNKTLADKSTMYEIGSVTKTFCGILLAMAINEKKINPEEDIRNYLPGKYPNLSVGKSAILIKHLANHTSGLARIPDDLMIREGFDSLNPYKNYTRQMMLDYLKKVKIQTPPGTVCDYSNYGMALLGLILEDVYKKPFEELVKEKICRPNHMTNTTIALSPEQATRLAQGYNSEGQQTPYWDLNGHVAAGALKSNTEDLLKYLNYNLAESDASTRLSHTITFSNRQNVGLAWFISKTKAGNTLTWHNGGTYGFASFCGFVKEKNCSVVILSNSATNVDYIAIAILNFLQT